MCEKVNRNNIMQHPIIIKKKNRIATGLTELGLNQNEFHAIVEYCNGLYLEEPELDFFPELIPYCEKWETDPKELFEKFEKLKPDQEKELIFLVKLYWANPEELFVMLDCHN